MILAAGESRRAGSPKLLLPWGGKTIIETVIDRVIQSKVDRILVVLGAYEDRIRKKIQNLPVTTTVNRAYHRGMLSSIQHGFASLPDHARAALVFLGDQPSIPSTVLDRIIDAWERTQKGIVRPVCKGKGGHPLLVDLKYREEVKRLDPNTGLVSLVREHADDMREIEVDDVGILIDIDTIENYQDEMNRGVEHGTHHPL